MTSIIKKQLITKFQNELGDNNVIIDEGLQFYANNTLAVSRQPFAALLIKDAKHLPKIVALAKEAKIPLLPISSGHNWGYGCALPIYENTIIVDLSHLKRISVIDPDLGLFEIEAGVTQGELHDFLKKSNLSFMVPTTGAGRSCSLLGNALDRGFGLSPTSDHISSIMSFEAVLGTGALYKSPFNSFNCEKSAYVYRYGIGPYIDGLFSQSNFAIISKVTIQLIPTPKHVEVFYLACKDEAKLETLTQHIAALLRDFPGNILNINLSSGNRMQATLRNETDSMQSKLLNAILNGKQMAWISVGGIFGHPKIVKVIKKELRKLVKNDVDKLMFFSEKKLNRMHWVATKMPIVKKMDAIKQSVELINSIFCLISGKPHSAPLQLAYAKFKELPTDYNHLNPTQDDVGLIWFAPLLPLDPKEMRKFVTIIREVSKQFNRPALITVTSRSLICFDGTIPIHFDKNVPEEIKEAKKYYDALFSACKSAGYFPYRIDVENMSKVTQQDCEFTRLARDIKKCFDPDNIIAPGKYVAE